jgi:hypothetical protein
MKLIKPSFEILEQKPRAIAIPDDMEIGPRKVREELLNSIYRQIEIAGRICYQIRGQDYRRFCQVICRKDD